MPKKQKLPPYVITKFTPPQWHVRRGFPTAIKRNGRTLYTQVTRRCQPETEERAKEISDEIERQYYDATPPRENLTLEAFFQNFIAAKKGSVSSRTYSSYDWLFEKRIKGTAFGQTLLEEIKPVHIQTFYADLARTQSSKMVRRVNTLLSMAFRQAQRWELITKNPCEGVILPKKLKPDIKVMTEAQAKKFMAVALDKYLVLAFALETGARPGEYLALQWKHINLNTRIAHITRAVSFLRGGGYEFKAPKTTKSKRQIHLSKTLCERLRVLRGRKGNGELLVFPTRAGTPIAPHNLGQRLMKEACKKAKIPSFTLYELRHSSATLALASGSHIKAVSERLGHSDIAITLSTYAHVLPGMRSDVADKLAEMLY